LAGVIALGGVWLVNHLDNSSLRVPSWMQASGEASPPPAQASPPPAPEPPRQPSQDK
jgi:hypothetical protein